VACILWRSGVRCLRGLHGFIFFVVVAHSFIGRQGKRFAWGVKVFDVMIPGRDASLLVFMRDLGS
jgi:hypothetical protein